MPMMRFISPVDPRWLSTMRALEKSLIEDTLVRRYKVGRTNADGLPGTEGSFTACSFWYVECLARAGELQRAQLGSKNSLATRIILASIQRAWFGRQASWKVSPGTYASRADQRSNVPG
jgi:GH15 family glucan-1,4-alpha-glucosidase